MDFPMSVSTLKDEQYGFASIRYSAVKRLQKTAGTYSHGDTIVGKMSASTEMGISVSDRQGDDFQPETYMRASVGWTKAYEKEAISIGITGLATRKGMNTDGEAEAFIMGNDAEALDRVSNIDMYGGYVDLSAAIISGKKPYSGINVMLGVGCVRKYVAFANGTAAAGGGVSLLVRCGTETGIMAGENQSVSLFTEMEYEQMPRATGAIGAANFEGRMGLKTTFTSKGIMDLF